MTSLESVSVPCLRQGPFGEDSGEEVENDSKNSHIQRAELPNFQVDCIVTGP